MADGDSEFGFLTQKIGPLPVIAWIAIAGGGYYIGKNYLGLFGGTTAATTATQPGPTSEPQPGISPYANNADWQNGAINYLVGLEIPPNDAEAAIWNYLHSKPLTSAQQNDVNLAIEGIGPPPGVPAPAPASTNKPPAKKPPGRKPPAKRTPVEGIPGHGGGTIVGKPPVVHKPNTTSPRKRSTPHATST